MVDVPLNSTKPNQSTNLSKKSRPTSIDRTIFHVFSWRTYAEKYLRPLPSDIEIKCLRNFKSIVLPQGL